jgi:hypothetical protein
VIRERRRRQRGRKKPIEREGRREKGVKRKER